MQKDSVGTILRWTVEDSEGPLDVSAATVKQVKLVKPDGVQVTKTLVFSSDANDTGTGFDGRVEYITEAGVINQNGFYEWQLYFEILPWKEHTVKGSFIVGSILF